MIQKIRSKKIKFAIYSFASIAALFSIAYFPDKYLLVSIIVSSVVVLFGALIIHYPNFGIKSVFPILLLPLHTLVGAVLSLIYFPNLGNFVVVSALISVGVVLYAVSLVNNIYLVVKQKKETIPLYRVALTWSQILIVVIAIPYFAGIFKVPVFSFYQSLLVAISSFLFTAYVYWSYRFDKDSKIAKVGEVVVGCLLIGFSVLVLSLGVSFIPTESFLRSLFLSSVLMSGIGYTQAHLKNRVKSSLIFEYLIISALFLLLLLVFKP